MPIRKVGEPSVQNSSAAAPISRSSPPLVSDTWQFSTMENVTWLYGKIGDLFKWLFPPTSEGKKMRKEAEYWVDLMFQLPHLFDPKFQYWVKDWPMKETEKLPGMPTSDQFDRFMTYALMPVSLERNLQDRERYDAFKETVSSLSRELLLTLTAKEDFFEKLSPRDLLPLIDRENFSSLISRLNQWCDAFVVSSKTNPDLCDALPVVKKLQWHLNYLPKVEKLHQVVSFYLTAYSSRRD